jgi:hypothetical protein
VAAYAALTQRAGVCEAELRILATQPAHGMTGVTSFVLLADIGDQRLRTLHLNLEGGDQRVFRVNDNVSRFPLNFKTNRKLHLCVLPLPEENSTIQLWSVNFATLPRVGVPSPRKTLAVTELTRKLKRGTYYPRHSEPR